MSSLPLSCANSYFFFLIAFALKCNYCISSLDVQCTSNQDLTCPPGFNRCFKGEISYSINAQQVKMSGKGCTTAKQCSDSEDLMCKKLKDSGFHDVTCKTACCSGDNCNTGPGIEASGQVIIMTLLFTMFIFGFPFKWRTLIPETRVSN